MDDETKKKDGGRRRIARTAVPPIGADKPLRATHRGNFKDAFGIDVDCYVLDDEQKTGVISKRGMGLALGMGESGSVFSYFIGAEKMVPYVGSELQQKLDNPLIFQWTVVGANAPLPKPLHGYDVLILLEVCKAIVKAADAGVLGKRHEHIVKQATADALGVVRADQPRTRAVLSSTSPSTPRPPERRLDDPRPLGLYPARPADLLALLAGQPELDPLGLRDAAGRWTAAGVTGHSSPRASVSRPQAPHLSSTSWRSLTSAPCVLRRSCGRVHRIR